MNLLNFKDFINLSESRGISDITVEYKNIICKDLIIFIDNCKNESEYNTQYYTGVFTKKYSLSKLVISTIIFLPI